MKRTSWVTWRLFLITIPVDVVVVVLLSSNTLVSFENAPRWIAVGLIAHAAIAPFFALGVRISSRFNTWKSDLLILIALGAIRGFAIVLSETAFGLPHSFTDGYRVFNSAIALPTWFAFFALVTEAKRQYEQEFKILFHQAMKKAGSRKQTEESRFQGVSSADELISRLQSLTSSLAVEMQRVLAMPVATADYANEASKIQNLVNKELRPTSAQLWQGGSIGSPRIFKKDLLSMTLLKEKLPINVVIFCSAPFLFVGTMGAYGPMAAIIQTSAATVPVLLSFLVLERLHNLDVMSRSKTNLTILGLSYFAPLVVQYLVIPESLRLTINILYFCIFQLALWIVLVTLLIGYKLYYSLQMQRQAVLASFESMLNNERYLDLMATDLKPLNDIEMSRYLHGEIQTGLTATSLLLQQASKNGDAGLAREALERAIRILSQDHTQAINKSLVSPELHLQEIISGWRGIANISIALDLINQMTLTTARDVVELVGEAVANAIRHGKATDISVSGSQEPGQFRVHIRSNGSDAPEGESGLGTKMFNELASEWSFAHDDGQSYLTFAVSTN